MDTLYIPTRFTEPIWVSPTGRKFYLLGGGSQDQQVIPEPLVPNPAPPAATVPDPDKVFTQADIEAAVEKARKQEKDKVYDRLNSLSTKLEEMTARDQEREAQAAAALAEREAQARAEAESQMDAKTLLEQRDQEWQQRFNNLESQQAQALAALQQERETERALLEKDRELALLQAYTQQRLDEERDNIAPQLTDFINGSTQQEIDQAISLAKAKSAEIAEQARAAIVAAQAQQRGTSVTGYAPVGPMEIQGGERQYSAADIQNMDMKQYAEFRAKVGMSGANGNRGLFG